MDVPAIFPLPRGEDQERIDLEGGSRERFEHAESDQFLGTVMESSSSPSSLTHP
jgi:hypothetical protein